MTDEEADALGARLAACPKFRPLPGLRDMQGRTWEQSLLWRWTPSIDRPDLREPATKGIVLALVREAWGDPHASVWYDSEYWQSGNRWSWHAKEHSLCDYDTEAEALVAALEASPTE